MKTASQGKTTLLAGAIMQFFLGIIYVWSVFVLPVSEQFNWAVADVKLTSSFMLGFFVLGILAGGRLVLKLAPSVVVLVGGLCMSAGMLLTSFIPMSQPWLMYVFYGVLGGFGVGMAYNTIISSAQKWYPQKRGWATGVSVCMFGFSTVAFAPLVELLVERFALTVTFRILAAAFAAVTLLLFRLIRFPKEQAGTGSGAAAGMKRQLTTSEMLRTRAFYFITASMMLLTASYFIMNPSFKTLALERGVGAAAATAIVMMTGLFNAAGRLVVPLAAGKLGREKAILSIIVLTAAATALLVWARGPLFMAAIAVIAFCYGGSSGVYPVITGDYFGLRHLGSNYGAIMVGFATSALFFPMLIGQIPSETVKFLLLAGLALVGAVLIVLLKPLGGTANEGQKR